MYVCQIVRKFNLTTGSTDRTVFYSSSHCDACSKAQFLGVGRSSVDRRIRSKEALFLISFAVRVPNFFFVLSGFKLNGWFLPMNLQFSYCSNTPLARPENLHVTVPNCLKIDSYKDVWFRFTWIFSIHWSHRNSGFLPGQWFSLETTGSTFHFVPDHGTFIV
jgi:hypothetical protein